MVECSNGMALIADDDNYQPNIITAIKRPENVRAHQCLGHARAAAMAGSIIFPMRLSRRADHWVSNFARKRTPDAQTAQEVIDGADDAT